MTPIKIQTVPDSELDVQDVVLHAGSLPHREGKLLWPKHTKQRVSIGKNLWLGPRQDKHAIMDACECRGGNTLKPYRQFSSHYAFFRTKPANPGKRYGGFDADSRLRTAIQLSRLVRPTTIGYQYAARVVRGKGMRREIVPYGVGGPGFSAYVLNESMNCLWDDDVQVLAELLAAFRPSKLPQRVKRALWHHEFTSWMYFVEIRLPVCVAGIEALVHTDERQKSGKRMKSTEQFVVRLSKLKQFVPEIRWTERDLTDIYEHRSRLVHGQGQGHSVLTARGRSVALAVEDGFRATLRACILKTAVADIFRSDSSVRTSLGF